MHIATETIPHVHVPGPPGDAGRAHGRAIADLLRPGFLERYELALAEAIGFDRESLPEQTERWLAALPPNFQEEIDGMAQGAGVPVATAARFLYADIAESRGASTTDRITGRRRERGAVTPPGPMCSSLVGQVPGEHAGGPADLAWAARNCDWLVPTLMRGVSAVCHAVPGRHPTLAVGINGDIDVDTGMNAAGLWLHLHTLAAPTSEPRAAGEDRPEISWLFWCREALETCASLDELERFIARTRRDKGVFAIAAEGAAGRCAIFECGLGSHTRTDVEPRSLACVTNHSLRKTYTERAGPPANPAGTVSRFHALHRRKSEKPVRAGPDDFAGVLAADGVEMRTPRHLRTIYSAIARPGRSEIYFAAGLPNGTPAASRGRWHRVRPPWPA